MFHYTVDHTISNDSKHWKSGLPEILHFTGTPHAWRQAQRLYVCLVCREFSFGKNIRMTVESDGCAGTENEVNYLEHVQAYVTLRSTYRGCVTIYLTSPMNTT